MNFPFLVDPYLSFGVVPVVEIYMVLKCSAWNGMKIFLISSRFQTFVPSKSRSLNCVGAEFGCGSKKFEMSFVIRNPWFSPYIYVCPIPNFSYCIVHKGILSLNEVFPKPR